MSRPSKYSCPDGCFLRSVAREKHRFGSRVQGLQDSACGFQPRGTSHLKSGVALKGAPENRCRWGRISGTVTESLQFCFYRLELWVTHLPEHEGKQICQTTNLLVSCVSYSVAALIIDIEQYRFSAGRYPPGIEPRLWPTSIPGRVDRCSRDRTAAQGTWFRAGCARRYSSP